MAAFFFPNLGRMGIGFNQFFDEGVPFATRRTFA
jgi:hypothetical protein